MAAHGILDYEDHNQEITNSNSFSEQASKETSIAKTL